MGTLDPVIHQATRLRIMAILQRNRDVGFVALRDELGTTDGNLNAHGTTLQKAGYVAIRKALGRSGFSVRYRLTPLGAQAFEAYARDLLEILRGADPTSPDPSPTASAAQRTPSSQLPSSLPRDP